MNFIKAFTSTSLILLFSSFAVAQVSVTFKLSPAGNFIGTTSDVKGAVKVQGTKISAENIVVNLKTLKTGIELRDKHTQDKLETAKFPEAVLISATGENGKGTGKVKIRGIEKPISGTYVIKGDKVEATFPLKLSDYKVEGTKYMGVGVKDELTVVAILPVQK